MVHVLLYVPNLIGYARVALLFVTYYYALTNWKLAVGCYVASFAGDLFDGYFARLLNQSSTFGGVLDMVTDRAATAGLLTICGALYPGYLAVFLLLQGLDLSSHWFHMYSTCTDGAHHKSAAALEKRNFVLRAYYGSYPLFAYMCVGAELTYVALYVHHFWPHPLVFWLGTAGCLPACVMKNVVNVAQFCSAALALADRDAKKP
ncbi:hypothetical protein M885DRAFT_551963 [Pelagophyceae sp. CCMP2097]|nr:hypothetical protein M885DRAFT_551963 [Pelagophyceae sp. CCMP2097]|mmetsp:Transcript_16759/g.56628  ORF Transcript_16759/g.56628 Transcript_16759/m.56628 type:complete len:204 (+) Transcript_16759:73-684(+)